MTIFQKPSLPFLTSFCLVEPMLQNTCKVFAFIDSCLIMLATKPGNSAPRAGTISSSSRKFTV